MPVSLIIGGQWGDEGKAKIIDCLSENVDFVARFQGGANAGHTVVVGKERFAFHLIPSGILYPKVHCVLGGGMVIDPLALVEEMRGVQKRGVDTDGRIHISEQAHLVMPYHISADCGDEARRGKSAIGTTKKGIGPAYADKVLRRGLRMADLLRAPADLEARVRERVRARNKYLADNGMKKVSPKQVVADLLRVRKVLKPMIVDTRPMLWSALDQGQQVLCEGAQGALLDIDHGTYPFVTSSSCSAGGAATGTGIPPAEFTRVIGIFKAYCTRVGSGPFPSEDNGRDGQKLRDLGNEYGTTTGRPRRCGWFDSEAARTVVKQTGVTEIALTKLDVLDEFDEIRVCTGYKVGKKVLNVFPVDSDVLEKCKPVYKTFPGWNSSTAGSSLDELPAAAVSYIQALEELTECRIKMVSTGPARDAMFNWPGDGRLIAARGAAR